MSAIAPPSILEAIDDPNLFKPWFKDAATWEAWRAFLAAQFGLPMTEAQREIFTAATGLAEPPAAPSTEAWLICGRRAGKSLTLALIAVYLAVFRDWTGHLAPGERGTILVLATDKRQSRVIMRYVRALLEGVAMLRTLIARQGSEDIDLSNRITIEIIAASFRTVRGYTLVAALCDEIAFWRSDESANPDTEILDALRPAMATIPGAMLLCASSPYARRGALWAAYKAYWGKPGAPALVWRADTRTMNPTVPQRIIDEAYERDPAAAAAEFGAEFRTDVEAYVSRDVIEACTVAGRYELPPVGGTPRIAFVDTSGGSSDSMATAIAHKEGDVVVVDAVRERKPPFSPEAVVTEFAAFLKSYGITEVTGDRYGGEWPRERFKLHGIEYRLAPKPASDIYRDLLPVLNSGKVELLDIPRLAAQLCGLERRTARGGRDSIDHAPGGHDDVAVAVAGAVCLLTGYTHRAIIAAPIIVGAAINPAMSPVAGARFAELGGATLPWRERGW